MSRWNMVRLGDVVTCLNGFAFKSENYVSKGIRVIRITNVQKGIVEDTTPQFYPIQLCSSLKKYYLFENDLLVSLTGNVGRVAFLPKSFLPAALNQRVACLRIKNEALICKNYLFEYLNSDLFENACINFSKGIAQKNMSTEWLKEYEIPLPPLEEQKKMASELEKLSSLLVKRKSQMEKLDLLVKVKFVEMFGNSKTNSKHWEQKRLDEISVVGSSKRVFVEELVKEGIPFFRGTEIGALATGEDIIPELFITKEHYQKLCLLAGIPKKGDLLMPSICPDGRIWRVDTENPFYFKDGRVLWIRKEIENINDVYFQHALKQKLISDYVNIASGTTFAELKIFALKKVKIMLPPFESQNQYAHFVTKVEQIKTTMQQGLQKLETLYKARLQEYFE